jgi:hypothetical protein
MQEDLKLQASLGYTPRPCLKKRKEKKSGHPTHDQTLKEFILSPPASPRAS